MNCNHNETSRKKCERTFLGEVFTYQTQVCKNCAQELWNNKLNDKFGHWISEIHSKKRHLFQVQYKISENASHCLDELKNRFPLGVNEAQLIRALVMVYLNLVEDDEEISEIVEEYLDTDDYHQLVHGNKLSKKVEFKASGMQDIVTMSEIVGIKPSKLVEETIYRCLLIFINEDPQMKKFWQTLIQNIEMILKAG